MKKILLAVLGSLLLFVFFFLGQTIDRVRNKYVQNPPLTVSKMAQELHEKLLVVDLHSDQLLWNRDLNQRTNYGHLDYPRAKMGKLSIEVFSSVTRIPYGLNYHSNTNDTNLMGALSFIQRWPIRTWFSAYERALYMAQKLERFSKEGKVQRILRPSDFEHINFKIQLGALFSLEGAHALEGDLNNLNILYDNGLRMIGLTHFFDNKVGGSAHGVLKEGLTSFGKDLIREMEKKGIIVDLAHASESLMNDVLAMASRPVVISHGGVKGTCPSPRNISDEILLKLKENGGVIGIGFWEGAICKIEVTAIVDAMEYVIKKIGVDHVALGSDYDGTVKTLFDTRGLAQITQELLNRKYSNEAIRKIMGLNALKLLKAGIQPLN